MKAKNVKCARAMTAVRKMRLETVLLCPILLIYLAFQRSLYFKPRGAKKIFRNQFIRKTQKPKPRTPHGRSSCTNTNLTSRVWLGSGGGSDGFGLKHGALVSLTQLENHLQVVGK